MGKKSIGTTISMSGRLSRKEYEAMWPDAKRLREQQENEKCIGECKRCGSALIELQDTKRYGCIRFGMVGLMDPTPMCEWNRPRV